MSAAAPEGERVAKLIARAGICSRRDAERLVAERRVAVDGRVLWDRNVVGYGSADAPGENGLLYATPHEGQFRPAVDAALDDLARNLARALAVAPAPCDRPAQGGT